MTDELKKMAARAALEFVVPGALLGVGTGSTTNHFIDLLASELGGEIAGAVASSEETAERLRGYGIPVVPLPDDELLLVYVDGADEVDPHRCLIKGGGGALTREKIVATASETFVCIVDASKRVPKLGRFPLAVEVIPLAEPLVRRELAALGGTPKRRADFLTDNGNIILDVSGLAIDDPEALERQIEALPGVVCSGLFARRRADVVLMATDRGLVRLGTPPR